MSCRRFGESYNDYLENPCTLSEFLYDICASVKVYDVMLILIFDSAAMTELAIFFSEI